MRATRRKAASGRDRAARERILDATIELLNRVRDPADLTVRAIAEKANVGVGLANYHFRDKGSLIRDAVRTFIGRTVIAGYGERRHHGSTPRDRVTSLVAGPIDFLGMHPGLSRVSVLYDLSDPAPGDNSDTSFEEMLSALQKILPASMTPPDLPLRLWMVIGAIHEAFLRPERFRARTGLDYETVGGRAKLTEFLTLFLAGGEGE